MLLRKSNVNKFKHKILFYVAIKMQNMMLLLAAFLFKYSIIFLNNNCSLDYYLIECQ